MKKLFLPILSILLLCSCSEQMDINQEKEAILRLLDEQSQCFKDMDADALLNLYIKDSTTIAGGPIPNLIVQGWDKIKDIYIKEFKNYQILDYNYSNPKIIIDGDKAWVITDITSIMIINIQGTDTKVQANYRELSILKKIDNHWKFALTNMQSFGATPIQSN